MHQMALLKSENQILRQSNEALSKRRRAKRTRLQDRGKMTVDKGREAIDQVAVNTQGVAESSRSGGRGESARAKERHCGICGKIGYNIRTYQIVVAMSREEHSE